ncbi:ribonuclease H-like domain-containing protein [Tanacetum coccineum]
MIDSIVNVLTSLDSRVNDEDLVHYALEGLPNKYDQVCGYMHHKDVFPGLKTARSMLITEEMRLKSKSLSLPVDSSSSSPIVLMADSGNSRHSYTLQATPQVKSWRPCFNFAKGTCRFGDGCKFVHDVTVKPNMHVPSAQFVNQAQQAHTGSTETILPHAFTAGTLHDLTTGAWNMDTGHSILPTPFKNLHLKNVLITPHIVKNLIYVRQFVRDYNCTIEFDAFGFSVKDFMTRRVLLRCDSTGDLYPVTAPSPIPHAFLVSQHTWHQHLGHPGSEVLRRLVSHKFISCNKEKPPVLCHACQLGKHVRLPFASSSTLVTSCFDIIHSDVWTSPIPSISSYKYYVLYLDHYSQFVWAYSLLNKSDVLSEFILFRTYVHTQFKCEIKSFQCDHGGEFDNRNLHKLFSDNGIQFRFSCPKTSQQNW